jgi:ABC-type transport system involved in multi-copper enzyme maturation permease subunit
MQTVEQHEVPVQDPVPVPNGRLYSSGQITLATFLGMPIAGAWLMARNYQALGVDAFAQAVTFGIIGTLVVLVLAVVLPESTPNVLLPIVYTFIVQAIARAKQGVSFQAHIANGGLKHSTWRVTGIGLVFLAAVVLVFVAVLFMIPESLWVALPGVD